jgi:hypothetical protein
MLPASEVKDYKRDIYGASTVSLSISSMASKEIMVFRMN